MHFRESNFHKFSGGACHRTPLETRAFGPTVYRGARLLCRENPPTSKLNETPGAAYRRDHFFLRKVNWLVFVTN